MSINKVAADGTPQTVSNHPAIPGNVIVQFHNLRYTHGMTLEDAITFIRGSLVPDGYHPYPFRKDTLETMLDKLRSIVATFVYHHSIQELQQEGKKLFFYLFMVIDTVSFVKTFCYTFDCFSYLYIGIDFT